MVALFPQHEWLAASLASEVSERRLSRAEASNLANDFSLATCRTELRDAMTSIRGLGAIPPHRRLHRRELETLQTIERSPATGASHRTTCSTSAHVLGSCQV